MTHVKVIHRVKNRKCGWSRISEGKLGCKVQSLPIVWKLHDRRGLRLCLVVNCSRLLSYITVPRPSKNPRRRQHVFGLSVHCPLTPVSCDRLSLYLVEGFQWNLGGSPSERYRVGLDLSESRLTSGRLNTEFGDSVRVQFLMPDIYFSMHSATQSQANWAFQAISAF